MDCSFVHGRKELFNLPPIVLKARAPNDGSAFCIGMVMKINFFEFSCIVHDTLTVHREHCLTNIECVVTSFSVAV